MRVDIRLLGGFDVRVDGEPVPAEAWRRQAPASLVKLLALARGRRLGREQVLDALWPELLVEQAAPRLHKAAYFARTALGEDEGVVLSGETVSLFPGAEVAVDVALFDEAAENARAHDDSRRAAEAVELYRGELLPDDLYEPWTGQERERLRLAHGEMLRILGRWDLVIAADPLDEAAHLRLVQDHIDRGDQRAALRQLELMEQVWQRELDEGLGEVALALRDEVLGMPVDLAPAARPSPGAAVPQPPTPTVGRDRDIERVTELLETSRTVTLLGPGGVGKTRLAEEVAIRRSRTTSVESCFVDLTKVSEAALVPGLVARELGIHGRAASDAEQALEEALKGREMLLVLDNFEHVLDAAGIARHLAEWSSDLVVLSTSRARLQIAGEQVYDVVPLSVGPSTAPEAPEPPEPDAIAMFAQVARAVDPAFDLASHLDDVTGICEAVDGLPLAIELAAGHVRTLPPELLRARLGARLASPSAAARGAPPRQRTVTATIEWSLQLLGSTEQELFRRLGVFAGAVPLDAIEQVCAEPGDDVVEALSRLVDHSLVRRVTGPLGEARFVLLELLRERARELLADDAELARDLARRHAEYVATFLDELDETRWSADAHRWIELITGFLTEVRLAHAWAEQHDDAVVAARITAGMGTYWHREGHQEEGRQWVAMSLGQASALDEYLVARLYLSAGFVEWTRDQPVARAHWEESVRRFRALGHDRYLSYSLGLVSGTYIGEPGTFDLALGLCDESIGLARRVGEQPLLAQALNIRGELTRVNGDDEAALAAYREGLDLATASGDNVHLSMFLGNLSFIAEHRGEHEEARGLCREALRMSWNLGRRLVSAMAVSQLAGPERALGRPERGAVLIGAGEEAHRRLGVGVHPGDRPEQERVIAALGAQLGEQRLAQLRAEGAAMPLDEAVELALSDD